MLCKGDQLTHMDSPQGVRWRQKMRSRFGGGQMICRHRLEEQAEDGRPKEKEE